MKKWICVLLVLWMALPLGALADESAETSATANAVAECVHTYDLTAPFAGVVAPFPWAMGDRVSAGDELFTLDSTTSARQHRIIYTCTIPCSGGKTRGSFKDLREKQAQREPRERKAIPVHPARTVHQARTARARTSTSDGARPQPRRNC